MSPRLIAAVTAAAVALLSPPAEGAPARDQVVDPRGDAKGGQAYTDILSARWSTSGRGAGRSLVVTMDLAAAPKTERPYVYETRSEVLGCGTVIFDYAPGPLADELGRLNQPSIHDESLAAGVWFECMHGDPGPADSSGSLHEEVTLSVKGTTLTWSVPFGHLPERVGPGAVFHEFTALADVGEPFFGLSPLAGSGQSVDHAQGDGIWVMR